MGCLHYTALLSCKCSAGVAESYGKLTVVSETGFIKLISCYNGDSQSISWKKHKYPINSSIAQSITFSENRDLYTFSRISYEEINWRKWESLTLRCDFSKFIITITVSKIVGIGLHWYFSLFFPSGTEGNFQTIGKNNIARLAVLFYYSKYTCYCYFTLVIWDVKISLLSSSFKLFQCHNYCFGTFRSYF